MRHADNGGRAVVRAKEARGQPREPEGRSLCWGAAQGWWGGDGSGEGQQADPCQARAWDPSLREPGRPGGSQSCYMKCSGPSTGRDDSESVSSRPENVHFFVPRQLGWGEATGRAGTQSPCIAGQWAPSPQLHSCGRRPLRKVAVIWAAAHPNGRDRKGSGDAFDLGVGLGNARCSPSENVQPHSR